MNKFGIQITTVAVLAGLIPFLLIWIKAHFQNTVRGKVYWQGRTKEGNVRRSLVPVIAGKIELWNKRRYIGTYAVDGSSTILDDYPLGWPSWMQVKTKSVWGDEESGELLSNKTGILTLSPRMLGNLINDTAMAFGDAIRAQHNEADRRKELEDVKGGIKRGKTNWNIVLWALVIIAFIALGVGVYFIWKQQQLVLPNINEIKQGLGIK
jgi:hypothetical protein